PASGRCECLGFEVVVWDEERLPAPRSARRGGAAAGRSGSTVLLTGSLRQTPARGGEQLPSRTGRPARGPSPPRHSSLPGEGACQVNPATPIRRVAPFRRRCHAPPGPRVLPPVGTQGGKGRVRPCRGRGASPRGHYKEKAKYFRKPDANN